MSSPLDELRHCTRCSLSQTRQRVVIGSGPLSPVLMVVGEAPGKSEDEGGEPFIGRSGQLLFRLIEEVTGLTRSECFVTNVVKCRPPQNRTPKASELAACRPWIDEQLRVVAPRMILAVGNTSAQSLFSTKEPMGSLHGRLKMVGDTPALATYHPAAALRQGNSVEEMMRQDLAVLAKELS